MDANARQDVEIARMGERLDGVVRRLDRHEEGCDARHEEIMARLDAGQRKFNRWGWLGAALAGFILAGEYGLAQLIAALMP